MVWLDIREGGRSSWGLGYAPREGGGDKHEERGKEIGDGGGEPVEGIGEDGGDDSRQSAERLGDAEDPSDHGGGGSEGDEAAEAWLGDSAAKGEDEASKEDQGAPRGEGDGRQDGDLEEVADADEVDFSEPGGEEADQASLDDGSRDADEDQDERGLVYADFVDVFSDSVIGGFEVGEGEIGDEEQAEKEAKSGDSERLLQLGQTAFFGGGFGGEVAFGFGEEEDDEEQVDQGEGGRAPAEVGRASLSEVDEPRTDGGPQHEPQTEGHAEETHGLGAVFFRADVRGVGVGDAEVRAGEPEEDATEPHDFERGGKGVGGGGQNGQGAGDDEDGPPAYLVAEAPEDGGEGELGNAIEGNSESDDEADGLGVGTGEVEAEDSGLTNEAFGAELDVGDHGAEGKDVQKDGKKDGDRWGDPTHGLSMALGGWIRGDGVEWGEENVDGGVLH